MLGNVVWWLCFAVFAIWMQSWLPGIDLLIVGVVICLEEGNPAQIAWVTGLCLLIQEGSGTLAFGFSILWYGSLIALFLMGRWLFQAQNFLFISLLGACLGLLRYVLLLMMATLQDFQLSESLVFTESVLQAAIFPLVWALAYGLRPKQESSDDVLA